MSKIPTPKNVAFVSVMEHGSHCKPKEETYKAYGHYCKVVFVSTGDLERWKDNDYRLMGQQPAVLEFSGTSIEDKRKNLSKFAGYPKFNFGKYYILDHLLLLDDVIDYGHGRITYDKIRTARDIIKGNKQHIK